MAGTTVSDVITSRWEGAIADFASNDMLTATIAFWPSKELLATLAAQSGAYIVTDTEETPVAWRSADGKIPADAPRIPADAALRERFVKART